MSALRAIGRLALLCGVLLISGLCALPCLVFGHRWRFKPVDVASMPLDLRPGAVNIIPPPLLCSVCGERRHGAERQTMKQAAMMQAELASRARRIVIKQERGVVLPFKKGDDHA